MFLLDAISPTEAVVHDNLGLILGIVLALIIIGILIFKRKK